MTTFTVFFCGTGSNRFDVSNPNYPNGEIVSKMASRHTGKEFVDWIICDGPGSGDLQTDELWVQSAGGGWGTGTAFGSGWEENVAHAVSVIKGGASWHRTKLTEPQYKTLKQAGIAIKDKTVTKKGWVYNTYDFGERRITPQELQTAKTRIFRNGARITKVNIFGWSRGAVSCIMLANALHADPSTRRIQVRIFAVDPVPGSLNFQPHRCRLQANVYEYVGVYARDECSKGFAPIIPSFFAFMTRKPAVLPFPGRHATLPGNGAIDGESGTQDPAFLAPGILVRNLAERCMTAWGTPLAGCLNLTTKQVFDHYATMTQNDGRFSAMKALSYTYFSDKTNGERTVGWGSDGTGTAFSTVKGARFNSPDGLSSSISGGKWLLQYNKECKR